MIRDVQNGQANFSSILVYDVSRWGRFQDADESAYYEYICRKAGVAVHYCAEQFENDGSPVSTIVKGVKRAMAGEYSRELSSKVFQGACRLIQLGYKQGGAAGFGLRRMLIDQNGQRKTMLKIGEQKSIQTDRVVLVRGPDEEVKIVRWIYEKFIDEEMLEKLRGLLKQHGHINGILIDEAEDLPSSAAFRYRFGSLVSAYQIIGYDPQIDYSFIEINRKLRKQHPEIVASVIKK